MLTETRNRPEYDLPTAVTFMIAGLALGAMLAALFSPLREDAAVVRSSRAWAPATAGRG